MRLFIAIRFSEDILHALTDMQEDMRAQGVAGNYTKTENLHLTLAFIGDYGNPDEVLDVMTESDFRPITLKLDGVGTFGDLFWAGIEENPALTAYVKRLRRRLAERGIPFDKKKFSPHVTLIRKAQYRNGKAIPVSNVLSGEMRVERIVLMQSERGRNGMIYTDVGSLPF